MLNIVQFKSSEKGSLSSEDREIAVCETNNGVDEGKVMNSHSVYIAEFSIKQTGACVYVSQT